MMTGPQLVAPSTQSDKGVIFIAQFSAGGILQDRDPSLCILRDLTQQQTVDHQPADPAAARSRRT